MILSKPELDKKAPHFKLAATGDQTLTLNDFKGKNLVIYFYPKDNTPGCTTEGQNFRDAYPEFQRFNTEILGVSRDSVKTHQNVKNKHDFPFDLLSDNEEEMCNAYDVIHLKKMYGKEYMGIERSTFLIDSKGKLRQQWRKVKVKGHIDEVLEAVKNL